MKSANLTRRHALGLSTLAAIGALASPVVLAEDAVPDGKLQVRKVLFLGNSITLHGPAPQIGWTGKWGMAASLEEFDYVHRLLKQMSQHADNEPKSMVRNIADFERGLEQFDLAQTLKAEWEFGADLVVIAIGENVSALATEDAKTRYAKAFASLLAEVRKHGQPTVLVRSCFWADGAKDEIMRQACLDAQGVWVDMSDLGGDEKNFARSERTIEHAGVAGHPGDQGMQKIAERLWKAITEKPDLWKA